MQPAHHDRILGLISSSKILSAQERQEWLDMLPLMNDKQTKELEEILAIKKHPANLSHIANLPTARPVHQTPTLPRRPIPDPQMITEKQNRRRSRTRAWWNQF